MLTAVVQMSKMRRGEVSENDPSLGRAGSDRVLLVSDKDEESEEVVGLLVVSFP